MKIWTLAIVKGGTGKTTTAAALAQAAAADGKRVLCIDLDAQGNLSFTIGAAAGGPGSYDLLHGTGADQLIQKTPQGIYAITASPDLATEKTAPGSAMRLKTAIEPLKKKFDIIILDTAPQMGELTFNALQAATGLLIPLETDNSSLQGLYQIVDIAQQMQRSNPDLKILGTVLTRYDPRSKLNRYLHDEIERRGREIHAPLLAEIRAGIAIREAQAMQQSIFDYAPRSKPAQDYRMLYERLSKKSK